MEIFVKGLSESVSKTDLKNFFEEAGFKIESVSIPLDKETHTKNRGFAFVTINDDNVARQAIKKLNGHSFNDTKFFLKESKPREERGGINQAPQPKNSSKPEEKHRSEPQSVSGSGFDYVIPQKTEKAITKANGEEQNIDNLHLRLNAFATMSEEGNDHKKTFNFKGKGLSADIPNEIKTVADCIKSQQNVVVREFDAQTASRLIVGLGSESVYEVSMTLHHIYGTPYIPGQSLKGAVRNFIISECFDKDEKKALKDKEFCAIFGKQDGAGKIIFYDVYPDEEKIMLEKDILTPHYFDYYGGKKDVWPTDTQKPVPNEFLTVPQGTKFRFFLGMKKGDTALLDKAAKWLKDTLEKSGVGAKTAVGYGYFKDFKEVK